MTKTEWIIFTGFITVLTGVPLSAVFEWGFLQILIYGFVLNAVLGIVRWGGHQLEFKND